MSLFDIALLPFRVGLGVADAVLQAVTPAPPAPPSELVVVDGMPEGVPAAALRPEPELPAPAGWPFGEEFPRTCGTSRFAGGALFWTDFLYDDHGATGVLVDIPTGGLVPPRGTYVYPAGPAARNGADIFRVAVGLTETDTWWRVDWNTLLDPSVPIALFTFDTDRGQATHRPMAGRGGRPLRRHRPGATRLGCGRAADRPHDTTRRLRSSTPSTWSRGPSSPGSRAHWWSPPAPGRSGWRQGWRTTRATVSPTFPAIRGALPGQPNVYNVAFRTHEQETGTPELLVRSGAGRRPHRRGRVPVLAGRPVGSTCRSPHHRRARRQGHLDPVVRLVDRAGTGRRRDRLLSTEPQFLGRVQPYSVCLPATYAPGRKLPLTLLLHSLALGQNQFAAIDPRLLHQVCDGRDSVVVTPLARGPSCWYFDEGELDVWEVWARVAEQLGTDPNRTVISGYSMGGYAAYKLGLTYPEVFAQAVVLAGPPTCGVRLLPDVDIPGDLDPDSHCAREGDTFRLLVNARWLAVRHRPRRARRDWCRSRRSCSRCSNSTGSATAIGSPSIRSRTTSPGCWRTSSTIRFRTWAPVFVRATPDTSPSRGIRSWCDPISALGHTGFGGCRI